jgi:HPr kinase/phosphorylase
MEQACETVHATCVAISGNGVLITGPSGSGKSALALDLMALGADLVADDRTILHRKGGQIMATAPSAIAGLVEARGIGLLRVAHVAQARIALVVDMARVEKARMPAAHGARILDITLPCLHKVDAPYFPAALHAYLRGSRIEE